MWVHRRPGWLTGALSKCFVFYTLGHTAGNWLLYGSQTCTISTIYTACRSAATVAQPVDCIFYETHPTFASLPPTSVHLSIYPSIDPSIHRSIDPSTPPFIHAYSRVCTAICVQRPGSHYVMGGGWELPIQIVTASAATARLAWKVTLAADAASCDCKYRRRSRQHGSQNYRTH